MVIAKRECGRGEERGVAMEWREWREVREVRPVKMEEGREERLFSPKSQQKVDS